MSDGKLSLIAGITVATSDLVPDDTILVVGDPSVEDFYAAWDSPPDPYAAWDSPPDPYAIDFSDWRFEMSLGMVAERRPVLRRPSWLHPLRRVLWVHVHGPEVPEIVPSGRYYRIVRRPSWLHPVRRVLWVHRNGPHVSGVKVTGGSLPQMPLSFAKITGVTS